MRDKIAAIIKENTGRDVCFTCKGDGNRYKPGTKIRTRECNVCGGEGSFPLEGGSPEPIESFLRAADAALLYLEGLVR